MATKKPPLASRANTYIIMDSPTDANAGTHLPMRSPAASPADKDLTLHPVRNNTARRGDDGVTSGTKNALNVVNGAQ